MTTKDVRQHIEVLVDESTGKNLLDSGAIKHIGIDAEKDIVVLIIAMGKLGGPEESKLRRELAKVIKLDLGFKGLKLQMEEKRKIESITNKNVEFIVVASGKGGVGKSTVAANIAYALTRQNKKVGIIDADVYGSSIPKILGMKHENPRGNENGKIIPFEHLGIQVVSTEFFAELGKPIIWRGAMLHQMMNNFFYEVAWAEDIDYMIIDAPPGTGDVSLDLKDIVPNAQVLIVTTPHLAASHVAIKAGFAAKALKHEIIGVVENMSYFVNPVNKQKEYIFGSGGGEEVADKLESELIAQIPIAQPAKHIGLYESNEEIGQIYDELATLLIIR